MFRKQYPGTFHSSAKKRFVKILSRNRGCQYKKYDYKMTITVSWLYLFTYLNMFKVKNYFNFSMLYKAGWWTNLMSHHNEIRDLGSAMRSKIWNQCLFIFWWQSHTRSNTFLISKISIFDRQVIDWSCFNNLISFTFSNGAWQNEVNIFCDLFF